MPVYEFVTEGEGRGKDGKLVKVKPQVALRQLGPTIEIILTPTKQYLDALTKDEKPHPKPVSGIALIDTGASVSAIDEKACQTLGLTPTGQHRMAHAGGIEIRACYAVQIAFPQMALPPLVLPRASSANLSGGGSPHIMLFGRELLANLKFEYNGPRGRIEITF